MGGELQIADCGLQIGAGALGFTAAIASAVDAAVLGTEYSVLGDGGPAAALSGSVRSGLADGGPASAARGLVPPYELGTLPRAGRRLLPQLCPTLRARYLGMVGWRRLADWSQPSRGMRMLASSVARWRAAAISAASAAAWRESAASSSAESGSGRTSSAASTRSSCSMLTRKARRKKRAAVPWRSMTRSSVRTGRWLDGSSMGRWMALGKPCETFHFAGNSQATGQNQLIPLVGQPGRAR